MRRDPYIFLLSWAVATWCAAAGISGAGESATDVTRPNLLIIQTDEHNFRTLGCYREKLSPDQALMWGPAVVETPHIDQIAHAGAICTSFYATTPVCSPSRSAFMSGCYPQNTPVVTNNIPMKDTMVTFAEMLRRHGYDTGYAGKWHLDGTGKPQWAPRRHFGFEDNRYMFNRGHWKQLEDTPQGPRVAARKQGKPNYSVQGATDKSFTTDFLADKAVDFIRAHRAAPFCFMVSLPDPHGPDTVRPPYDTMYEQQTYKKPRSFDKPSEGLPGWAQKTKCGYNQSKYYGMVKCIDDNVGKVLDCLREEEILDNTIVIFTSDHGDLRGEHARHNKGVPFEGSARIPFLIRYTRKIRSGTVINEALSCVDFKSTILRLMGFASAGPDEGRDCSPLFLTGKAPAGWRDLVFLRGTGGGPTGEWLAAVSDRYKMVWGPYDAPWLYDLEKDADEVNNYFQDPEYRDVVRELSRAVAEYAKEHGDPRAANPGIQYDLKWAEHGSAPYSVSGRPTTGRKAIGRRRNNSVNRKKKQ